jgi:hypothetical protein
LVTDLSAGVRTRFLHVANGTCTTRLIEAAGIPGTRSIWADVLYEGPVPGNVTDAELLEIRRQFLGPPAGEDAAVDPALDLREWRATIERYDSYDELILWFEHDLFDQLNLIQLMTWIRGRVPASKPVNLVCIGSFPGHPHFKGLGELTAIELAPLLDTRQPVSVEQYTLAERAWHAFREPTPEPLNALRHTDTSALPYLAAAIVRFLQEFPWTVDGLSRTERRLMRLADGPGIDLQAAFPRMQEGETAYSVTDGSLASLAEELSRSSPPLLTFARGRDADAGLLEGSVTLTDTGRAVLAGRQDRISACGFDRWLGGVHLQSGANLWRWDDARQRVIRA